MSLSAVRMSRALYSSCRVQGAEARGDVRAEGEWLRLWRGGVKGLGESKSARAGKRKSTGAEGEGEEAKGCTTVRTCRADANVLGRAGGVDIVARSCCICRAEEEPWRVRRQRDGRQGEEGSQGRRAL